MTFTNPGSLRDRLGITHRAKVMMLGCFHFNYPDLDFHVSANKIDILSEQRQAEVQELVDLLSRFQPTKVAVEARPEHQPKLQQDYEAYLTGEFDLPRNELYQLGFRLAKRAGHRGVFAIDAEDRHYEPYESYEQYLRARFIRDGEQVDDRELWFRAHEPVFRSLIDVLAELDEHKANHTLREHLLLTNSPEYIEVSHGPYLSFVDSPPGDFTLVDMTMGWHNRNLRIFANLKRLTESPDDRILVIYGGGHVPLLRHAIQSSPFHQWVDVTTYLEAYR